jgi:preprotein translocase subunit SecE
MAIVRTTSKENGTTGSAPPNVRPKSPSPARQTAPGRPAPRTLAQRAATPGTQASNGQFISDVKAELKRVHWPTKDEVRNGVIVTILLLAFFALYIFGLDYVAESTLGALFKSGSPR